MKRKQRKEKDAMEKKHVPEEAQEDKLAILPVEAFAIGLVLLILLASFYVVSSFSTNRKKSRFYRPFHSC